MDVININNTVPEEVRRAVEAKLMDLRGMMDRLNTPNAMSAEERGRLRKELEASDEASARTRIRQEVMRLENQLQLIESRMPRHSTRPDPVAVAADARRQIESLTPLRARLACAVMVDGLTARMEDLEAVERRLRRLELEAERAELIAQTFPETKGE